MNMRVCVEHVLRHFKQAAATLISDTQQIYFIFTATSYELLLLTVQRA